MVGANASNGRQRRLTAIDQFKIRKRYATREDLLLGRGAGAIVRVRYGQATVAAAIPRTLSLRPSQRQQSFLQ
jgi:hypothetical protein